MDQLKTTSDVSLRGSISGFLSSLGGGNGDSASAKLFANLLSQNQSDVKDSLNAKSAKVLPDAGSKNSVSNQVVLPSLKNLTTAWHEIVNRLQNQVRSKTVVINAPAVNTQRKAVSSNSSSAVTVSSNCAKDNDTNAPIVAPVSAQSTPSTSPADQSNNADTNTAITPTVAPGAPLPAPVVATSDTSVTAATGSDSAVDDNTKTLAEILAELLAVAQQLEMHLKAAATVKTDAAALTAPVSSAKSNSDTDSDIHAAQSDNATKSPITDLLAALNAFAANMQVASGNDTGSANDDASKGNPIASTNSINTIGNIPTAADQNATADASAPVPTPAQALTDMLVLARMIARQLDQIQKNGDAVSIAADQQVAQNTGSQNSAPQVNAPVDLVAAASVVANAQSLMGVKSSADSLAPVVAPSTPAEQNSDAAVVASNARAFADVSTKTPLAFEGSTRDTGLPLDERGNALAAKGHENTATAAATDLTTTARSAGITEGDANRTTNFDLGKDSQNNSNFSASARASEGNLASSLQSSSSANSPYSFASQLAVVKTATAGVTGLPPAVEQVMLQLNRNAKSGNDQMTLQLNPAELGRVSIKLETSPDGKVQGTVTASNPATLDLLLKDVRSLERALQDAGLRADPGSLQFSLGGQGGNASGQPANEGSSKSSGNNTTQNVAADLVAADSIETYYVTPGRVNLRV